MVKMTAETIQMRQALNIVQNVMKLVTLSVEITDVFLCVGGAILRTIAETTLMRITPCVLNSTEIAQKVNSSVQTKNVFHQDGGVTMTMIAMMEVMRRTA